MDETAHTPPGLPVVGNAARFADDPLRFLVGVQEAYGGQYPLVRLDSPAADPLTIVLDAESVHEVLADRDRFRRPTLGPQERRRQGLVSSDGALWERQRSVLQPEFVGTKLADYADVAGDTVEELLAEWPERGELDLFEELSVLTMRVITRSLFSGDASRERAAAVHDALSDLNAEFEADPADVLLPDALDRGPSEAFLRADDRLEEAAREYVDAHLDSEDPPRDVITALIEARRDPEIELSENELIDQTVLFMTGGQETTALTIAYAFYWLSRNPAARERVRAEADVTLDGAPEWADLGELTFTERVVRETLRLTPAVWSVARQPREPTELAGVTLGEDELVLLPTYSHHRDGRVFSEPERFRPDRWDGEVSRSEEAYFPFGSGPRVCIGRQVALTEAQFALAHVLSKYDVDVTTERLDLRPSVTLRPGGPVRAEVRARD